MQMAETDNGHVQRMCFHLVFSCTTHMINRLQAKPAASECFVDETLRPAWSPVRRGLAFEKESLSGGSTDTDPCFLLEEEASSTEKYGIDAEKSIKRD
jgi:hypothetical protein